MPLFLLSGPCQAHCGIAIIRPAAARDGLDLDPSACFGVSLFRHEIVGYKATVS